MKSNKNTEPIALTRRAMVRTGTLSLAGAAIWPLIGSAQSKKSGEAPSAKKPTRPVSKSAGGDSVFNHCVPSDYTPAAGSTKYKNGDDAHTFPIYALWLMLTTENWENLKCDPPTSNGSAPPDWWTNLYEELFAAHVQGNPNTDHEKARQILFGDPKLKSPNLFDMLRKHLSDNKETLLKVQQIFDGFITQASTTFYGGRPCPGGGTILQIAGLAPINRQVEQHKNATK